MCRVGVGAGAGAGVGVGVCHLLAPQPPVSVLCVMMMAFDVRTLTGAICKAIGMPGALLELQQ